MVESKIVKAEQPTQVDVSRPQYPRIATISNASSSVSVPGWPIPSAYGLYEPVYVSQQAHCGAWLANTDGFKPPCPRAVAGLGLLVFAPARAEPMPLFPGLGG